MPRKKLPDIDFKWTLELAYAVGLITTDGNLSNDGRHISFRSFDTQLLETFKKCLNLSNRITLAKKAKTSWEKKPSYKIQFGNVQLYRWFLKIGLTPAKTYTIGEIKIPDKYFADFLRGHLDGDGSITFYEDKYNQYKNRIYTNNRLYLRFISASQNHIFWLQNRIKKLFNLKGSITKSRPTENRISIWTLKFSKKESVKLLNLIYYQSDLPTLNRKRDTALLVLSTITNEKRKEYSWVS